MSGFSRISSENDSIKYIDENGIQYTPQAEPFAVQTRLGGWKPICIRHKLIFNNRAHYDEHWTPVCDDFGYRDCPPSDLLRHLKGYKKA